jgi:hypothetical protein
VVYRIDHRPTKHGVCTKSSGNNYLRSRPVLFGRLLLLVEQAYGNRHSYTYSYLWFPRAKDLCMVAYGELVRSFATNLLRKVREVDTHFLVWPPYSQPLRQFRAG